MGEGTCDSSFALCLKHRKELLEALQKHTPVEKAKKGDMVSYVDGDNGLVEVEVVRVSRDGELLHVKRPGGDMVYMISAKDVQ